MSSGGSASTWWSGLAEVLSNDIVENAQISSLRWPRGQRVLHGEVFGCDFAKDSELRWRESASTTPWSENTSWDIKRAKSWVEQRALQKSSFSPIHLFISTPQELQLRTTPTLVSYSNTFPTSFSFFSSSRCHPLSVHSVHFLPNLEFDMSRIVEISGALITTLHRGTNVFPVLDWDPKQWLIILIPHSSIQERCAGVDVHWQKVREKFFLYLMAQSQEVLRSDR